MEPCIGFCGLIPYNKYNLSFNGKMGFKLVEFIKQKKTKKDIPIYFTLNMNFLQLHTKMEMSINFFGGFY